MNSLKLTLLAIRENIARQEKLKEQTKKEILKACPFNVGEKVHLVRSWDHFKAVVTIRFIYVTDIGEYIYSLSAVTETGRRITTDIKPGHFIEKITKIKFNHEHTKQRFRRLE